MKRLRMLSGLAMMIIMSLGGVDLVVGQERGLTITPEQMLEAESPAYRALSDQQRVGVIGKMAAKEGGYKMDHLYLLAPCANYQIMR